ncbi:MAG TPA: hypothetical protein H9841_05000 [Candidatus Flavonifractor merdigallinarum]|uniref:Uncharacterized protein n=1 Tax=Candidatus Flavonifractor merdigallinarum TaxID=2838589 RepID=A0A9D2BYJ3_9FIRM|nr:hypothetical protein [Candidatus Flavonifractor merdigallinarum]
MGTLAELAGLYIESAARLKVGIAALEARMEELDEPRRRALERDIALLRQMLRETREVGEVVGHYYDRSYWRGGKYTC